MKQTPEKWKATYTAGTPEDLDQAYRCWAPEYDRDTCRTMGYVGPATAASLLDHYLDDNGAQVLDAGCGTGLVGQILRHMGYGNVHGTDYCRAMLEQAENKAVYNRLFQGDMNTGLNVPDNSYDAAICVGTFTYAHVGPQAFDELARVTRPEGFVCFTVRHGPYQDAGYRARLLEMEADNRFELQQMLEEDYLINEDVTARYCVYKVPGNA
jgi:ubiquinone/menaquinone biosynthesis C-methylase UbiE